MTYRFLLEDGSGAILLEDGVSYLLQEFTLPPPPSGAPPPNTIPNLPYPQANGGQTLTPNEDVYAPVRMGGSVWGANGGGAVPVAQPRSPLINLSNASRDGTFIFDAKNNRVLMAGLSHAKVSGRTADKTYADDSTTLVWSADKESPNVADSQL